MSVLPASTAQQKAGTKAPFRRCMDYLKDSDRLLNLTLDGVSQVARSADFAEKIRQYELKWGPLDPAGPAPDSQEVEERLALLKERSAFAQQEKNRGFPLLHAHAVVEVWVDS